jgi:membrane fusion protein, copper/silver efflux system
MHNYSKDQLDKMKNIIKNRTIQIVFFLLMGFILGWIIFKDSRTEQKEEIVAENAVWTCSMHPQIRQGEPGQCPICGMDLIPVKSQTQSGSNPYIHTMSPEAVALANIQTERVGSVFPEHEVNLTGRVAVNEQNLEVITADYSGRIEKLFIDFTGQEIRRGQKLASVYSPELVNAQKELIEAAKNKETNPVLYNAVREKLRLLKITESQIETIEKRAEIITEMDIYAYSSGIVLSRNVSMGDYVSRGSVLFEIADLNKVWILMDAYESDIALIRMDGRLNFTVPSIPGREFTSVIKFIDPVINPQTRTVSVRAEADNPGLILKPEMFVRAKIQITSAAEDKSLVIPKTSVLWTGKRSIAYVKVQDAEFPSFEIREVELGAPAGDFYIVESGLQQGEEVVTNGAFAIDAAAQLSGNYSMMNRPVQRQLPIPEKFQLQLSDLFQNYFDIKNALVESNFIKSKNAMERFSKSLNAVDMSILDDKTHAIWMDHDRNLREIVNSFLKLKDITDQRQSFSTFSNELIETAKNFRIETEKMYVDYCPMAFDDQGGLWLSEFEEIRNPYFGDEMLKCGEIREVISSGYSRAVPNTPSISGEHRH